MEILWEEEEEEEERVVDETEQEEKEEEVEVSDNSPVQFHSIQDGISALGKAHICALLQLAEVSPALPLKQLRCSKNNNNNEEREKNKDNTTQKSTNKQTKQQQ